MDAIPFNKPHLTGVELKYIGKCLQSCKVAGDGSFTQKVHQYFEKQFGFKKVLLTASCTDALEMSAILINIKEGDEVIVPAYTFVSTTNAFILRGAKIVFCDSSANHPNIDADAIEPLITNKTKAIVLVHYAGVAGDMDKIISVARKHNLFLIEDAAHAIDSYYKNIPLGSFGNLSALSFNETKNIIAGEGGLLMVNDKQFETRAEIIREKGTNRTAFGRGETNKYEWLDIGSSYLAPDTTAAFLLAQLESLADIQQKRMLLWNEYFRLLKDAAAQFEFSLPVIPAEAKHNAHIFYMVCKSKTERDALTSYLSEKGINAAFHYLALHKSPYYTDKHDGRALPNAEMFSDCLLRLPLYYDLTTEQVNYIADKLIAFYTAER
jgi:dTDP-4-amino-4,6-dideoxygalactose transaminase